MEIYVKAVKKLDISGRKQISVKDFAEVVADEKIRGTVENITLPNIDTSRNAIYLISVTDVIRAIKNIYPDAHIINVGEKDTIINYSIKKKNDNSLLQWLKILFVAIVLFFGSATAIMSFFSDAEIGKILENFYFMVFRVKSDKPLIVEIPYSIGISVGIIVFFNHIGGHKIMEDPTPIEVEMRKYDSDVSDTVIESMSSANTKKTEV